MAVKTTSQDWEASADAERLTPSQSCWIKYQLNLSKIRFRMVAEEAGLANSTVSDFMVGRKNSERTKVALCKLLGYESFATLLKEADAAYAAGRRRAA
jgi:hypothetical protein